MLLRSGVIVSFFTLLCRIFGLIREFAVAAVFGTSGIADCVNVAFKIPNLFRRIFGEGALASVFIPIFTDHLLHKSKQEAEIFSSKVMSLLIGVLLVIIVIMELLMPYFMAIIAPGFYQDPEKFNLAIVLVRITTPYLLFISVAALMGSILNSLKRFAAFAFAPILMSVCVILSLYYSSENMAPYAVSYALLVSGILQVIFMYICTYRAGIIIKFNMQIFDSSVVQLIRKMGPATLTAGAQQLNLFISQSIASFVPGALSILSYADRLYQFPLALIGISFATILLPELSSLYKAKNHEKANAVQNKSIELAALISVPAAVGLTVLATPIINLLYERGAFTRDDTILTANVLAAFAFGLPAFIAAKVITPIYYANSDAHTPFRISLHSFVANSVLNVVLVLVMRHVGIAIASSLAAWLNVYWLWRSARKNFDLQLGERTLSVIARIILAGGIMGVGVYLVYNSYHDMFFSSDLLGKILLLTGFIGAGVAIFSLVALVLGIHRLLK